MGYMEATVECTEGTAEVDLKLDMPKFETEAEEAAWWPTQEGKLFTAFKEAAENGTLKRARYTLVRREKNEHRSK